MRDIIKKKKGAWISAVAVIVFLTIILVTVLIPVIGEVHGEWIAMVVLVLYALVIVAVILGIFIALKQRIIEIESGEEEDAKQY